MYEHLSVLFGPSICKLCNIIRRMLSLLQPFPLHAALLWQKQVLLELNIYRDGLEINRNERWLNTYLSILHHLLPTISKGLILICFLFHVIHSFLPRHSVWIHIQNVFPHHFPTNQTTIRWHTILLTTIQQILHHWTQLTFLQEKTGQPPVISIMSFCIIFELNTVIMRRITFGHQWAVHTTVVP